MTNEHKFQVNLKGVIDLLSHHLYSGPQVYIRELMQNAVDAITARELTDPAFRPSIQMEIVTGKAKAQPTLVVTDNGIGLTEEEVHQFLATIGRSSKRESLSREDFLGQFGIGLLSGFVVSDEIVVITRSLQPDSQTVKWTGRTDGTYKLELLDVDKSPGTEVYLRSKVGSEEFFEPAYVKQTAGHFGSLLPFPIVIQSGTESVEINDDPPWRLAFESESFKQEAYLNYGKQLFGMDFFDAIPLNSKVGEVEGIAFVLPHVASLARKKTHRVYLKNMLLSENVDNLLPDWAFFVKCVVNANDLRPTAARESFYEDSALDECRTNLGESLRDYLIHLSKNDRGRLDYLISLHHLAFKALAVEDDEFYRLFMNWLPFETSLGHMTLAEYRTTEQVVRYVHSDQEFRQIAPVASSQNINIINACHTYEQELLQRLPGLLKIEAERFDVNEISQEFQELSLEEREAVFEFLNLADVVLQPFRCRVTIKKFAPATLPTLFTTNESAQFLRSIENTQDISNDLWSGVLDRIAEEPASVAVSELCLNYHNPLVRQVTSISHRGVIQRSVEMLYVQSLLLGHFPLKSQEMKLLNEGLLGLIQLSIDNQEPG